MLRTMDEDLHELQSAQSKDMGVTQLTKSGNDADVTQTSQTFTTQVSYSIQIGHTLLQHILLHLAKYIH